jgi:hypothetical protein
MHEYIGRQMLPHGANGIAPNCREEGAGISTSEAEEWRGVEPFLFLMLTSAPRATRSCVTFSWPCGNRCPVC